MLNSKKCITFAPAIPRRGCLHVIGGGSRHIKKAFITLCSDELKSRKFLEFQDLATIDVLRDIDCPSCLYFGTSFAQYVCAYTHLKIARRMFIFGVGFALSVLNSKAMREPQFVERQQSDSTLFYMPINLKINPHSLESLCNKSNIMNTNPTIKSTTNWQQHVAAWLLVSSCLVELLSPYVGRFFYNLTSTVMFLLLVSNLLTLGAFGCLYFVAKNKPTKIALLIILGNSLFTILENVYQMVMMHYYSGIDLTQPSKWNAAAFGVLGDVLFYLCLFLIFANVYAYSLILTNNKLQKSENSWISLLAIIVAGSCIRRIGQSMQISVVMEWDIAVAYNFVLNLFSVVLLILFTIAYWKLAHSSVFDQKNEESIPATYSPFNKYVLGLLIVVGLSAGLFYVLYINANSIIYFFNSIF